MGGCPGGQRGSEHKDGPFQPVGNQASVAGAARAALAHKKPKCSEGDSWHGLPRRDTEALSKLAWIEKGCRKATIYLELKWGSMWRTKLERPVHAFQQKEVKKNVGSQLKGPGHVVTRLPREVTLVTSAFSLSSRFLMVNSALTSPQPLSQVAEFGAGSAEFPTAEKDEVW